MSVEKKSLVDEAYEKIRQKICDFELLPGQAISDFILSKALGMSRTPIREALRRIESDGLITNGGSGQSYHVSEITKEDLKDLFDARIGLELTALCILLRDEITDDQVEFLSKINERMEAANKEGLIRQQFHLDQQFHDQLIQMSGNVRLIRFAESLRLQLSRVRVLSYLERSYQDKAYREHKALLKLIKEKKDKESIVLLRNHIKSTELNYVSILENRLNGESLGVLSAVMRSEG